MAKLDEKQVSVARVYSRAMLDLAESEGQAESLFEELRDLAALMHRDEGFRRFLISPLVKVGERAKFLEKNLRGRASDLLVNSLQVLNSHGRLDFLDTIIEVYHQEYQGRHGRIDVRVTTAVPLDDALRQQLRSAAERMVGREPELVEEVDESLIGGMIVRVGDRKIDTSVANDLRKLRHRLSERAGQEIHLGRLEGGVE